MAKKKNNGTETASSGKMVPLSRLSHFYRVDISGDDGSNFVATFRSVHADEDGFKKATRKLHLFMRLRNKLANLPQTYRLELAEQLIGRCAPSVIQQLIKELQKKYPDQGTK